MSEAQVVDPSVSRSKFDREVALFRGMEETYRRRGWLLLDAAFPEVMVAFAVPKIKPAPIAAAVLLDFTNYDLRPPSVRFIDPFTRQPLKAGEMTFQMVRRPDVPGATPETLAQMLQTGQLPVTHMIQALGPDDIPFLCLPGVREYHDHPAHTGDSWLLHRRSGEGSLHFILESIWKHGVEPLDGFNVMVQVEVRETRIHGLQMPLHAIPA